MKFELVAIGCGKMFRVLTNSGCRKQSSFQPEDRSNRNLFHLVLILYAAVSRFWSPRPLEYIHFSAVYLVVQLTLNHYFSTPSRKKQKYREFYWGCFSIKIFFTCDSLRWKTVQSDTNRSSSVLCLFFTNRFPESFKTSSIPQE